MKAGTAMDPFPESYPGDPMANVREEDPPKDPVGDESEDEESEDLNTEPEPDEDSEVDAEASGAR